MRSGAERKTTVVACSQITSIGCYATRQDIDLSSVRPECPNNLGGFDWVEWIAVENDEPDQPHRVGEVEQRRNVHDVVVPQVELESSA